MSVHELVEEDSEPPDIHGVIVGFFLEEFRAHVLVGTTEGAHFLMFGSLG